MILFDFSSLELQLRRKEEITKMAVNDFIILKKNKKIQTPETPLNLIIPSAQILSIRKMVLNNYPSAGN